MTRIGRSCTRGARCWLVQSAPIAAALVAVVLAGGAAAAGCGGGLFGKVYEYEEDVYPSLDGSAEIIVNASAPALAALRGLNVSMDPEVRLDREVVRAAYTSPVAQVTHVSRPWRRQGRRFIQVRLSVPDIRKLPQAPPFAWSAYEVGEKEGLVVYKQTVGASALRSGTLQKVGWAGGELVAFRLHLPSKIAYHNARDLETNLPSTIARGNILSWEQALTDRLDGRPVTLEVHLERQSILHRTLWLFFGAFLAAVLVLAGLVWWTLRSGKETEAA
jgi:hypothetical protein